MQARSRTSRTSSFWSSMPRLMAALVVILLASSSASMAEAQEAQAEDTWEWDVDFPPGRDVIVSLQRNGAAPFAGQLFDPDTATRWGHRIERYRTRIRVLERDLERQAAAYESTLALQLRVIEESYQREVHGLREDLRTQAAAFRGELREERREEFWESWGFAFALGVVLTSAAAVALAVAAN